MVGSPKQRMDIETSEAIGQVGTRIDALERSLRAEFRDGFADNRSYAEGLFERSIRHADGRFETLRIEIRGLRDDMGSLRGEVGSLRDDMGSFRGEVGSLRDDMGSFRGEMGSLRG